MLAFLCATFLVGGASALAAGDSYSAQAPSPNTYSTPAEPDSPTRDALRDNAPKAAFVAPALQHVKRAPFGSGVSKATPVEMHHVEHSSAALVTTLWIVTIALALAVVVIAARLGRIRSADGSVTRGLTLGSKLTLAMGSLAVIILTVGTMSLSSMQSSERLMNDFENIVVDANHAMDLQMNVYLSRMATRDFQIDPSQDSLDQFTNYAGYTLREIEAFEHTVKDPDVLALVGKVKEAFGRYEAGFVGLVRAADEERAIIDSQLNPVGVFISDSLHAMLDAAKSSGDASTAMAVAEELEALSTARLSAMKYLETGTHSYIEESFKAAEHLAASARSLTQ
jgi:hypothetical protein